MIYIIKNISDYKDIFYIKLNFETGMIFTSGKIPGNKGVFREDI